MKTIIFCGGMGTRLKEETEFKPKPMVTVGGYPILWHVMKIYSSFGHKEFILRLGYKGDMIKEYFIDFDWRNSDFSLDLSTKKLALAKNSENYDWKIHFVETGLESMTATRLLRVKHILMDSDEEDFMLTYGDGVADIDIGELVKFHKEKGRLITLTGINPTTPYGIIEIDQNYIVKDFAEKPTSKDFINGGFMVFNKKIFEYLEEKNVMLEVDFLPKMAERGQVAIYHHKGFWHSMDTYRDFSKLNELWAKDHPWKIWK